MFQDYSINFLNLAVLQCDAINIFSHTGLLTNPKGSGQALVKDTLFILALAFLLNIEAFLKIFLLIDSGKQ